jgi:Predicted phosphatase/phosphohexomutase
VRSMVNILEEESAKQGYVPDASVAGDDVKNGVRPLPHMLYKNLDIMNIESIQSVIKVDDTVSGIGEAINAGCWGVGVTRYSNYMNINSLEEADELSKEEIDMKQGYAKDLLYKAGAHYVIETIADIEAVIYDINKRLSRGEGP